MSPDRRSPSASSPLHARRAALVEGLRVMPRLASCSPPAVQLVTGIRLIALCARKGIDPVAELSCRLGSVTAAKAVLDLAGVAGTCWPEPVRVFKPCCAMLSPDESVFAAMAEAAARGDRTAFAAALDGLVRVDRRDRLFDHAIEAVALIRG